MHQIKYKISYGVVGSSELYHAVRAGFVSQGTSLNRWCIAKGVKRQTVDKALRGERFSRYSRELLVELIRDAGLEETEVGGINVD